jgi:hypothetical protein
MDCPQQSQASPQWRDFRVLVGFGEDLEPALPARETLFISR